MSTEYNKAMQKPLKVRIILGAIMIAAMVGLLVLDWWLEHVGRPTMAIGDAPSSPAHTVRAIPLAVLCFLLIFVAFGEVARMAAAAGVQVLHGSGLLGACALGTIPFWWQFVDPKGPTGEGVLLAIGVIVILVFAEQMARHRTADALRQIACTLLAVLYLGAGMGMILSIRFGFGVPVLTLFLAAVKFTDIGAYFTGTAIGRHKMIPWLSPGKSWEGLIGGLIVAAGVSVLAAWWMKIGLGAGLMALWKAAVFGAVVGAAGQFADLCESLLKRAAGLKDAGALVPEFGGVLDILDSPLLSAPVAMILLAVMA